MRDHLQLAMGELTILCTSSRAGLEHQKVMFSKLFISQSSKKRRKCGAAHHSIPSQLETAKCALKFVQGNVRTVNGTHISAYLFLVHVQCENEGNLEWPMRGFFSVKLLKDQNRKPGSICFEETKRTTTIAKSARAMHQVDGARINFSSTKTLKRSRFLPRQNTSKTTPFTFELP